MGRIRGSGCCCCCCGCEEGEEEEGAMAKAFSSDDVLPSVLSDCDEAQLGGVSIESKLLLASSSSWCLRCCGGFEFWRDRLLLLLLLSRREDTVVMGMSSCGRERCWSLLEGMLVMGMSSGWLLVLRLLPRERLFPELMILKGLIVGDPFLVLQLV